MVLRGGRAQALDPPDAEPDDRDDRAGDDAGDAARDADLAQRARAHLGEGRAERADDLIEQAAGKPAATTIAPIRLQIAMTGSDRRLRAYRRMLRWPPRPPAMPGPGNPATGGPWKPPIDGPDMPPIGGPDMPPIGDPAKPPIGGPPGRPLASDPWLPGIWNPPMPRPGCWNVPNPGPPVPSVRSRAVRAIRVAVPSSSSTKTAAVASSRYVLHGRRPLAPLNVAWPSSASTKLAPVSVAPDRSAPARLAWPRSACDRLAPWN